MQEQLDNSACVKWGKEEDFTEKDILKFRVEGLVGIFFPQWRREECSVLAFGKAQRHCKIHNMPPAVGPNPDVHSEYRAFLKCWCPDPPPKSCSAPLSSLEASLPTKNTSLREVHQACDWLLLSLSNSDTQFWWTHLVLRRSYISLFAATKLNKSWDLKNNNKGGNCIEICQFFFLLSQFV